MIYIPPCAEQTFGDNGNLLCLGYITIHLPKLTKLYSLTVNFTVSKVYFTKPDQKQNQNAFLCALPCRHNFIVL